MPGAMVVGVFCICCPNVMQHGDWLQNIAACKSYVHYKKRESSNDRIQLDGAALNDSGRRASR